MSYQVWVMDYEGNTRLVDEHELEAPQAGEWIAYLDNGNEREAVVGEVRFVRQRDGSHITKVIVPGD